MPLVCPHCGSRHLRYAHRRTASERLWSWVGVRPLRCRDCRKRFVKRTWRLSSLGYVRCPACWRMDLNTWSPEEHRASIGQLLMLRMGARPYRCEYCRINFVSFRKRLETFSHYRWRRGKKSAEEAALSSATHLSDGKNWAGEEPGD